MKRHAQLWDRLIDFENIYLAFEKTEKGKGYKHDYLRFLLNLESNLLNLQEALATQTYVPGGYRTFDIYEPKKRMISAASFGDRVVHHCLVNIIGPIFENSFIQHSYANQVGKGTHKAIREVQKAMQQCDYALHCDVRKYFPSIDHEILKDQIRKKIKDSKVLWLIDLIIDGSNEQEWVLDYFPGDDLLTPLERRRGLPIGNLTSQFFANIYLNGLDHYMKEVLGCTYYMRYVDDMVVLDSDKGWLWTVRDHMRDYIEQLRLKLHPCKQNIRPVKDGLRFLGQVIYPDRRLLPKQNVRRFMRRMKRFAEYYTAGDMTMAEINHSLQSWLGHAKQANTFSLRAELLEKVRGLHSDFKILKD
ncbi:RNA-directed DNA polymerase [candidate division KSB1 bacterium]|nr:RNA-directed DNA polymerase [candidate division KSB1 bacterium]